MTTIFPLRGGEESDGSKVGPVGHRYPKVTGLAEWVIGLVLEDGGSKRGRGIWSVGGSEDAVSAGLSREWCSTAFHAAPPPSCCPLSHVVAQQHLLWTVHGNSAYFPHSQSLI